MIITSAANEKIKQVSALIRRHKERKATGLFTAEGIKIFSEAKKTQIEQVFVSESFCRENEELLFQTEPVIVRDDLFARMCDTQTPQGILTVLKQPVHTLKEIIGASLQGTVLVLEDVQDPGNVGTILRTAEGAGAAGLVLSTGCADLFAPKTIRSTMGSVLRVPAVYTDDLQGAVGQMKQAGITVYAAHLQGQKIYDEQEYAQRNALLIGNEGRGLSDALAKTADIRVRIPMEGKLESLNASVAAGILMYTIYSKRNSRQINPER